MKTWIVIDRTVVVCISALQLFYSGYVLLWFVIGHGPGGIIAYSLWGVISALILFTFRPAARLIAIAWQVILAAGTLSKFHDPHAVLVWIVPPVIYLGATAYLQYRNRKGKKRLQELVQYPVRVGPGSDSV